jgi:hypothetical protein
MLCHRVPGFLLPPNPAATMNEENTPAGFILFREEEVHLSLGDKLTAISDICKHSHY